MDSIRSWKKVFENDLDSIILELNEVLESPAVIILSGELGVGKTTFIQKFAKIINAHLNLSTPLQSPTYSIINECGDLVHADFYRLDKAEDLVHLEIPLYLEDKEYFMIEWGRPYLSEIKKYVDDYFNFYEVVIEMNELRENQTIPSRNIILSQLT